MRNKTINNSTLIQLLHRLLLHEYKLYRRHSDLSRVYMSKKDVCSIVKDVIDRKDLGCEKVLGELISRDLLIRYSRCYDYDKCYRTIYFDVLHDYVTIRQSRVSKPTVFEYKILGKDHGLIKQPLPLRNKKCDELYNEVLKIVNRFIERDKYNLAVTLIEKIICLKSRYAKFQYDSIINITNDIFMKTGKSYIINAPTGWGKTEAFIIPILIYSVLAKLRGTKGVKAILVYPRKALASNQVKRLIEYYIQLHHSFNGTGMDINKYLPLIALRDGQSLNPNNYEKDRDFRVKTVKTLIGNVEKVYDLKIESEERIRVINRINRSDTLSLPITNVYFELTDIIPDIIVTNIDTFNRFLTTPRFEAVWRNPRSIGIIVFDESHAYNGSVFLHLAYVIRRINAFLFELQKRGFEGRSSIRDLPVLVFSSATLYKNFKDVLRKVVGLKYVEVIDYHDSIDPNRWKIVLPIVISPQINVAGQWIAQLITIYNALIALSIAVKQGFLEANKPVPYKSITFIDSIFYLRDIWDNVNTLLNRLGYIAREHMGDRDIDDPDLWSFIDEKLVKYIDENIDEMQRNLINVHYADLDQSLREYIEESFRERLFPVLLLSTSTLELGIDIPDLWNITQFRPPFQAESFIQRIGRAGRREETLRIAIGSLILTNKPSDIMYIYDENKMKELFEISELRVPTNETLAKQHIFLALFDILNILYISNIIDKKHYEILNSLYYKPSEELSIKSIVDEIRNLLNVYKEVIIKYLTSLFYKDFGESWINRTYNEIINDLEQIMEPDKILKCIAESSFIDQILNKIDRLHELDKELDKILEEVDEISEDVSFSEMIGKKLGGEIHGLKREIKGVCSVYRDYKRLKKCIIGLYEKYETRMRSLLDTLNELIREVESQLYLHRRDKKLADKIRELHAKLEQIYRELKDLHILIIENEDIRRFIEFSERLEEILSEAKTLSSYLSLITNKGMYYSSLFDIPLKHVQINYSEREIRNEQIESAIRRLSNFTIYKSFQSSR